jgi:excisionase family DNA binding protein
MNMTTNEPDRWISVQELAEYLGLPVNTIYAFNRDGTAPPRSRFGRAVRYRLSDVMAWTQEHRVTS